MLGLNMVMTTLAIFCFTVGLIVGAVWWVMIVLAAMVLLFIVALTDVIKRGEG